MSKNIIMRKFETIITDFDDQDCYKFFMQYAVFKLYPEARVKYSLILRDNIKFPDGFAEELLLQIEDFKKLKFTKEIEQYFVQKLPWFDNTYIQYLRSYRYDTSEVKITQNGSELKIDIEGLWHKTIMWEVPIMACVSELYFKFNDIPDYIESNISRWKDKFEKFKILNIKVSEFGTRRRKSKKVQEEAIRTFINVAPNVIVGTSNVMFSRKFNIKAQGTQAHEWYMFHAAKYGVQMSNRIGLGKWVDVYHGALGTALSDTYTSNVFYNGFDLFYSKLFDGVRQDSGNPVEFAKKTIAHYRGLNIILPNNLIPKTIVFSDSIDNHEKIEKIEDAVSNKILSAYGIGTWITFDIVDLNEVKIKHINMVIKMTAAMPDEKTGWRNCVKLSDDIGKITGDKKTAELYKFELGI